MTVRPARTHSDPGTTAVYVELGARLALRYRWLPSVRRLRADYAICRATAYRWRNALQAAGISPQPRAGAGTVCRTTHCDRADIHSQVSTGVHA